MGQVELATVSFGQSFQITPLKLATTVSSLINGGHTITPHFGIEVRDSDGLLLKSFSYEEGEQIVSSETSETLQYLLEQVVSEGTGKNGAIAGFSIGGKTATSQTLPRSANKYIASFLGFAPADDPVVLGLVVINNPQGTYYGGTIAAPVMKEIFENVLPYLGIEQQSVENDEEM
jgi:stage V sporulation protein D (sporulation-specific penicillin-binding protein)